MHASAMPSANANTRAAGWRFSRDHDKWARVDAADAEPVGSLGTIRLATFNCLHDWTLGDVLQHEVRHDAICQELAALNADVIGLNEVTRSLLERVLREEWVRSRYTVSAVPEDARCNHLLSVLPSAGAMGNILLSKIPPSSVNYIDQIGDGRHSHVMTLCLADPQGGRPLRLAVSSSHLTACPWLMEGRRKVQLEHITSAMLESTDIDACVDTCVDTCVVMGDFNFHREAENASIPQGWEEVPAIVALGATWDFARNRMLAHYLPLRNLYNGLGLGASFGWPSPMRLDRVLVHGTGLDCAAAEARLFADQPIHERARGQPPLPHAGRELREAHRALPWQDYLFCSDHFGIFYELPIARSTERL